eukprot:8202068-Heterocapsa_arctica.AAC.1
MAAASAESAAGPAGRMANEGSPAAGIRGSRGCRPAAACGRPWRTPIDGTAHSVGIHEWAGSVDGRWSTHAGHVQAPGSS